MERQQPKAAAGAAEGQGAAKSEKVRAWLCGSTAAEQHKSGKWRPEKFNSPAQPGRVRRRSSAALKRPAAAKPKAEQQKPAARPVQRPAETIAGPKSAPQLEPPEFGPAKRRLIAIEDEMFRSHSPGGLKALNELHKAYADALRSGDVKRIRELLGKEK